MSETQLQDIRLLVIGDNLELANTILSLLRAEGSGPKCKAVQHIEKLSRVLEEFKPDLVLQLGTSGKPVQNCLKTLATSGIKATYLVADTNITDYQYFYGIGVNDIVTDVEPFRIKSRLQQWLMLLSLQRRYRKLSSGYRELQARHRQMLDISDDGIAYLREGLHIYCNNSYAQCFGKKDPHTLHGTALVELVKEKDQARLKRHLGKDLKVPMRLSVQISQASEKALAVDMCFIPIRYQHHGCLQLSVKPAAGNPGYARHLINLKRRDLLTRLLNAQYFSYRLENAIHRAVKRMGNSFLLLVQIDRFREIKAASGLADTNLIIIDISQFLRNSVKKAFIAARLSENEFALLLKDDDPEEALNLAKFIRGKINNQISPAILPNLKLSCTIGIASINEHALDAAQLIQRARASLGAPLESSRYPLYQGNTPTGRLRDLSEEVKQAVINSRIKAFFQPLINLQNEKEHAYHVIPYLVDSNDNEIAPDRFMPSVMLAGVGNALDRELTELSLTRIQEQNALYRLFLNLSADTLLSRTFLPWFSEKLESMRFSTRLFQFTISEIQLFQNPSPILEFIRGLGELNLQCALTHYGCALEHGQHLERIRPTCVFLDQSLVRDVSYSRKQRQSVQTMVETLHAQGCLVASPDIVQLDQLPILWSLGIDLIQGPCLRGPGRDMNFDFPQQRKITQAASIIY